MPQFAPPDWLPLLFADQHAIRNVIRGMHGRPNTVDTGELGTALLIFCLFFVSVWGIARLFMKPEGGNPNSVSGLLRELCRGHQLSKADWWLLTRLARHHQLTDPAALFLEPHWLDPHQCGASWQRHAARLKNLQLTLFAGLASPYQGPRT
ncbi:MAG TPA: hypothetical protein VHC22_04715 [Pirellulales bacterium]|nr:hypothetical protein [Pirellulales bacterium]